MSLHGLFSICKKEIRSHFLSPVAMIFLLFFLAVNLFLFFTQSRFFIRGIADVRPLFEWMPLLLVFLISVISMKQWSEEQKMGTLEILLTLPIKTYHLVLGKFLAGMILVVIALALTLPIVYTVSTLGPIDMGPVWGGYVAALLLASAYLSMGLCLSALTDNQIVALLLSAVIGGLFYLVGSDVIAGFVNQEMAELLALIGTGSRFASIERGVLDFRDLFYYASITVFFLSLNTFALEKKRIEINPLKGFSRWQSMKFTTLLFLLNLVASNVILHHIRPGRIDLTEDRLYSVSDITVDVINSLDEQIEITGFFSERTHPLLAPLVPQIKDLLAEYQARGKDKLKLEFVDPHQDEALEKEIAQSYDIKSIPISVADRTEMAFVNAYFHILIKYGNEYQVLDFQKLVDIRRDHSKDSVELRLRSLEYDITKAIKAVSKDFQSLEALMSTHPIKVTAYLTAKDKLPTQMQALHDHLKTALEELQQKAQGQKGKFEFSFLDPTLLAPNEQERLANEYGFMPVRSFDGQVFYLYGLIELGTRTEPIFFLQQEISKENLKHLLENAIRKTAPGFKKTVGIFTKSEMPEHPAMPFGQPPPEPRTDYNELVELLSNHFIVKKLEIKDEMIPSDIDVLLVAKSAALTDDQKFAIDQYLMTGGSVIAFIGQNEIEPDMLGNARGQVPPIFKKKALNEDLTKFIAHYGVKLEDGFVVDRRNLQIVYPTQNFSRIQISQTEYPYFVNIPRDAFASSSHLSLQGLNSLTLLWPSALSLDSTKINDQSGIQATLLLESSEESWITKDDSFAPTVSQGTAKSQKYPLALALQGKFTSLFEKDAQTTQNTSKDATKENTDNPTSLAPQKLKDQMLKEGRLMTKSSADAKLIVVGSPDFASDLGFGLGRYYGSLFGLKGDYESAVLFVQNLIEWSISDDSLIAIRTAGPSSRMIKTLKPEEQNQLEWMNYASAAFLLILLYLIAILPRTMKRFED
jgi:ABC-2 type transport system permease protein